MFCCESSTLAGAALLYEVALRFILNANVQRRGPPEDARRDGQTTYTRYAMD
jgi:hypothetical protein